MKLFMMAIAGWLAGSAYAQAADYLRPTLTDQYYNWSGYYAGADFGAVFGDIDVKNDSFNSAPLPPPPSLVVPRSNNFNFSAPWARLGIEAGMNVQEGFFVYGIEADAL